MFTQVIIALKSAYARAEAKHSYQRLLEVDEQLMRDIGVNRGDVGLAQRLR